MLILRVFVIVASAAPTNSLPQEELTNLLDSQNSAGSIIPTIISDVTPDNPFTHSATIAPKLLEPVNGAIIKTNANSYNVRLSWKNSDKKIKEKFFIEVIAFDNGKIRDIFSGYVDTSFKEITLETRYATYAWRIYSVREDISQYAVTDWNNFSFVTK
jgi:hypothetical protein